MLIINWVQLVIWLMLNCFRHKKNENLYEQINKKENYFNER